MIITVIKLFFKNLKIEVQNKNRESLELKDVNQVPNILSAFSDVTILTAFPQTPALFQLVIMLCVNTLRSVARIDRSCLCPQFHPVFLKLRACLRF
jgi:hypothetical protein